MSQFDVLDKLVEKSNGYLRTSQVLVSGVSKPTLAEFVKKRNMERVAQGVYLAQDAWRDELYLLTLSNSRIVFSHETALMLLGLTEREPVRVSVTVPAGYNASHLREKGVGVSQVKEEFYRLGIEEVQTSFGNSVRVYDPERTICDILRGKASIDPQVFQYAMKEYMAGSRKNLNRLMTYAKVFRLVIAVRTYTEVLL